MKKNYGCIPVLASTIEVDNNCNFVLESWDSRLNIWKDQVPFMKKDNFCKITEVGSDRDGSYCHYKFVFPYDYVENEVNSKSSNSDCLVFSNKNDKLSRLAIRLHRQIELNNKLLEAIAFAIGRPDIVPHTNEGNLCIEVREYLLNALKENKVDEIE